MTERPPLNMIANGQTFDLNDPDQTRAFLRALVAQSDRENRTPTWELVLLACVAGALVLVALSAVLTGTGVVR